MEEVLKALNETGQITPSYVKLHCGEPKRRFGRYCGPAGFTGGTHG